MARRNIEAALDAAVAAGLPGVAAAARLPSGEVVQAAAGVRGLDSPAAMTADTVFWIASCTKAITTAAALQLVEEGRADLDAPVGDVLPQLGRPQVLAGFDGAGKPQLRDAASPITLRRLLAHTSGLAYEFCHGELARWASANGAVPIGAEPDYPLMFEPGSAWTYGVGVDWTGKFVEAVTGERLDAYLERRIFAPLGMADTSFAPGPAQAGRRASMHARSPEGGAVPMPFALPPPPHFMMGGGGLYATAGDYLKFLGAILAGGAPILKPESVAAMRQTEWEGPEVGVLPPVNPQMCAGFDPFPGRTKRWGLGFLINPEPGPNGRAAGSLAWAGLGNCYYWADPASGAAGVWLTQLLPFGDAAALEAFGAFERAVYSA